jgi:hypothetical protein
MTTNISKETIKRLLSDIKHVIDSPLVENVIYYNRQNKIKKILKEIK